MSVLVDDGDSAVAYSDGWTHADVALAQNGSVHLTSAPGATATLAFSGPQVEVYVAIGGAFTAQFAIDGADPVTYVAPAITGDTTLFNQLLFRSSALSDNKHTLVLTVLSAPSPFMLDSFKYLPSGSTPSAGAFPASSYTPSAASPVSVVDDASGAWSYSDGWQASGVDLEYNGTTHGALANGVAATMQFSGVGIKVYGTVGTESTASATFTIDGGNPTTWIAQSSSSSDIHQQLFFDSGLLDAGKHTLSLGVPSAGIRGSIASGPGLWLDYAEVVNTPPASAPPTSPSSGSPTPSSTDTTSTTPSPTPSTSDIAAPPPPVGAVHSSNRAAVIGGAVGGVLIGLLLLLGLLFFLFRRRRAGPARNSRSFLPAFASPNGGGSSGAGGGGQSPAKKGFGPLPGVLRNDSQNAGLIEKDHDAGAYVPPRSAYAAPASVPGVPGAPLALRTGARRASTDKAAHGAISPVDESAISPSSSVASTAALGTDESFAFAPAAVPRKKRTVRRVAVPKVEDLPLDERAPRTPVYGLGPDAPDREGGDASWGRAQRVLSVDSPLPQDGWRR